MSDTIVVLCCFKIVILFFVIEMHLSDFLESVLLGLLRLKEGGRDSSLWLSVPVNHRNLSKIFFTFLPFLFVTMVLTIHFHGCR